MYSHSFIQSGLDESIATLAAEINLLRHAAKLSFCSRIWKDTWVSK